MTTESLVSASQRTAWQSVLALGTPSSRFGIKAAEENNESDYMFQTNIQPII